MLLSWVREGLPSPDEGYLWYGTLRTLDGEVPLRDFRSYEPARYYWCALWMLALGRGVVSLRIAVHAFYFLGLTCGLLALRLAGVGWLAVVSRASSSQLGRTSRTSYLSRPWRCLPCSPAPR